MGNRPFHLRAFSNAGTCSTLYTRTLQFLEEQSKGIEVAAFPVLEIRSPRSRITISGQFHSTWSSPGQKLRANSMDHIGACGNQSSALKVSNEN